MEHPEQTEEIFIPGSSQGPIEHFSWGKFIINGEEHSSEKGVGKNILVHGEKVLKWKKGKGHHLRRSSLDQIKDLDIDVLVIGNGARGAVRIDDDLRLAVTELGINELMVERTPEACRTYNRLHTEESNVCLLAHGTC